MGKTQYYTATSVDGYIADERNSLDWLFEVEGQGEDRFQPFFAGVGAFAMGSSTYEWVLEHEKLRDQPEKWQGWYGDRPSWVFTHHDLPAIRGADVTFVSGNVRPVHEAMAAAAGGRNIWLVGGGALVGAFADQGLLDEIILGVAPVTLGAGAPLLPRRLPASRLALTGVEQVGSFAYLTYRVNPPAARSAAIGPHGPALRAPIPGPSTGAPTASGQAVGGDFSGMGRLEGLE